MALAINQGAAVTVAVVGTAVQLTSTVLAANVIYIEADSVAGDVYIGSSAVSGTEYIAHLRPRESWSISVDGVEPKLDPSTIYVDSNRAGSKVHWGWA